MAAEAEDVAAEGLLAVPVRYLRFELGDLVQPDVPPLADLHVLAVRHGTAPERRIKSLVDNKIPRRQEKPRHCEHIT